MKRQISFVCIIAVTWFVLSPMAVSGQSQTETKLPQAASTPASLQGQPAQNPPGTKPVKVWSNDDINELPPAQGVSTVGNEANIKKSSVRPQPTANKANPNVKTASWYRQQLAPLRAEAAKLDGEIQKTKAFIDGENVGEPQPFRHTLPVSPADQLRRMEEQRRVDQGKIDDLLDRARHDGIAANSLQ
jgi:hypothetical protein